MLGLFGLIMEVMQVLRSGRGTQMLVPMERQHLVDMCVLRKVEEHRTKRDHATKNPRAETKTCCPVRMGLTLDRVAGNYEVFDLLLAHNHVLHLPKPFI